MRDADATSRPPGPAPRSGGLVGNGLYYARYLRDPLGFVAGRFQQYGDIYCAPNPDGLLFVVRRPEHVRQVLTDAAFGKGHTAFAQLSVVLGQGLLTADGEHWKRHRRMIQPAFAPPRLAAYGDVMVEETARFCAEAQQAGQLDMSEAMMRLTLRIVSRSLFGHDPGGQTETFAESISTLRHSIGGLSLLPAWVPGSKRNRTARATHHLDVLLSRLIQARRRQPLPGTTDLLQMLIDTEDADGTRLSDVEIRDELMTFYLAGHETTSQTLSWALYLLSQNPVAEDALQRELETVLAGERPRAEDLARLPYTQQVVKESMRLYPPAYALARRASRDTAIGDYQVPRGSEVTVWIYFTHRDPTIFPDPEAFRPERFVPEAEAELPKMAYLPFGGGPRACIGKNFALLEATLILATLAQTLRPRLVAGSRVTPEPRITLAPKHGLPMRV